MLAFEIGTYLTFFVKYLTFYLCRQTICIDGLKCHFDCGGLSCMTSFGEESHIKGFTQFGDSEIAIGNFAVIHCLQQKRARSRNLLLLESVMDIFPFQ